jgi:hypothetical protein
LATPLARLVVPRRLSPPPQTHTHVEPLQIVPPGLSIPRVSPFWAMPIQGIRSLPKWANLNRRTGPIQNTGINRAIPAEWVFTSFAVLACCRR